jgi:DNA (cytosine-5)-methyltransferase 1
VNPTAIDAFAGAGGLSLGLLASGWRVALAFDNDPVAVDTYRKNIGEHVQALDAARLSGSELLDRARLERGELGLLAGGPPCQGFSLQRRHPHNDARNLLVAKFLELILETSPRSFVMENVPAVTSKRGRHLVDRLIAETESYGYEVHVTTLNAVDYGLAQQRRRAFVVGIRDAERPFQWPAPAVGHWRTVRDAIGDLPSPPGDGSPHPTVLNHYREARLSPVNIERIKHVPEGGGREHLPPHLQLACHRNGHRHLDTYGRLAWNEPSGTITARFDSFTRGRFGHPTEHRSVTLREGARLQGFPDDFAFLGTREDGARLIGNAVPPPVAAAVGVEIKRALGLATTGPSRPMRFRPRGSRELDIANLAAAT